MRKGEPTRVEVDGIEEPISKPLLKRYLQAATILTITVLSSKLLDHMPITRITFGAFAFALVTFGCDPADDSVHDDELLIEDGDAEIDDLAAPPADENSENEPSNQDGEADPVTPDPRELDFDLVAASDPTNYTWTGYWLSEEYPAVSYCPEGHLVTGVACSGAYCDNTMLQCSPVNSPLGTGAWTSWFSEEGTNWQVCSGSGYVSAMTCLGAYCDSIALRCSPTNTSAATCYWSGYFSEETPPFLAPVGTAIKGMQCDGSYCDNKRYYYCTII